MIKQKRSKVKQAILPFVSETTYEIITPRAGLVLFGEFLYGLRLNQMADKYLPLPKSGRGYKPKDFILLLVLNACLPTGRKEDEWRPYENGSYIAETVHCMEKTNQAFRLIVVRKPYQPRLSGEEEIDLKERYKVIATNFDWPKDVVVKWKSLLFSFNFHSFSCQKYPSPKINRGFWEIEAHLSASNPSHVEKIKVFSFSGISREFSPPKGQPMCRLMTVKISSDVINNLI